MGLCDTGQGLSAQPGLLQPHPLRLVCMVGMVCLCYRTDVMTRYYAFEYGVSLELLTRH